MNFKLRARKIKEQPLQWLSHGKEGKWDRKHKKLFHSLFLLLLAGISILVAFQIQQFGRKREVRVVYIPKVYDEANNFWMDVISGAQSAAREFQAELTVLAPEVESDYEAQKRHIQEAIARKPDVIAISPILYSDMTEDIEKIIKAGIKLVLIDSKIDRDIEECYVGTDNIKAGIAMGETMAKYVKEDTKIAVMAHMKKASTAIEREQGMRQGLGKDAERIVKVMYCDSDFDKAFTLMKEFLNERKDVDMVAGLNLYSIVGVTRAVKELGLDGKVKIIGFDFDKEEIQYIEEGVVNALVVQKPFNMGYLGIQAAVNAANGKKVEKVIDSGMEIVTVDNLSTEEIERLLFSF